MSPRRRYTIEEVKRIAGDKGGACLSSEVNTTKDYLDWKCSNGHEWSAQLKNVLEGRWCRRCSADIQRHSIEKCHALAESNGGKCLSKEYVNTDTKLRWECEFGHQWEARPAKVKKGQWCPYCLGRHRDITYWKAFAKERGGECLSTEYVRSEEPLVWQCSDGHIWEARPNNVKFGTWCPYCAGKRQSIDDLRDLASERGGRCLSKEYRGQAKKVWWECADGHQWKAVPNSIKSGSWCPKCNTNYGEEIVRQYFELLFDAPFENIRPDWLFGLELDGYNERLAVAFEHNGKQHYEFLPRFHKTKASFEEQLERDRRKRELCAEHGVSLIEVPEIPSLLTLEEAGRYIVKELEGMQIEPLNDLQTVSIDYKKVYGVSRVELLHELAKKRGGELLSDTYLGDRMKLRWRCANGHEWEAAPNGIQSGTWCPHCYGNIKKDVNYLRELASARNFKLISTEYKGRRGKVSWECPKGHRWMATPAHIASGTGCPVCTGRKAGPGNTLGELSPTVAAEWHPRKNGALQPDGVTNFSNRKAWWLCQKGHEYQAVIGSRTGRGASCPYCSGKRPSEDNNLFANYPAIASEWHPTLNDGQTPSNFTKASNKKVWWLCPKGHEYQAIISNRTRKGQGCPYCSGRRVSSENNLETLYPNLAREWHPTRNGSKKPKDYTKASGKKVWWLCPNGHEYETVIGYRTAKKGTGCPVCAGRK